MRRVWLATVAALSLLPANATAAEPTTALAEVRAYRQAHAAEIVSELVEWLSLPNVATNVEDIQRNAEKLKAMMERRGIRTEILPTRAGRPVVYGELAAPGATTTLLIYGHYDGQAVERATGGAVVKLPTLGGSGPLHYFDALGLPSVGLPIVNYDNNQHGPDENLRLGNFFQGIDIFALTFLWE